MITHEQNEYLCRTGPGTPTGELFRRHWVPALMADELPRPNCPPVQVQLLGERLIAFRDTQGRLGLMDEFCAHHPAIIELWRNHFAFSWSSISRGIHGSVRCASGRSYRNNGEKRDRSLKNSV